MPGSNRTYDEFFKEEMEDFNNERHRAIWALYEDYVACNTSLENPIPQSNLQVIVGTDLILDIDGYEPGNCDTITSFKITKRSQPSAVNFMAYQPQPRCVAFKGQKRLMDEFLDFATEIFTYSYLEIACTATVFEGIPPGIVMPGLSYDTFAGYAEIIECIVWLKESQDIQENESIKSPQVNIRLIGSDASSSQLSSPPSFESTPSAFKDDSSSESYVKAKSPSVEYTATSKDGVPAGNMSHIDESVDKPVEAAVRPKREMMLRSSRRNVG